MPPLPLSVFEQKVTVHGDELRFEEHRGRLRAVAYRMLGSVSEAEDAVQEAWLRLARADPGDIGNLGGWLTTVTTPARLSKLDVMPP